MRASWTAVVKSTKHFRLDSRLALAAVVPPLYPFCCVLCVIVLMENQSSPCGSLANWSRFSVVKISTAWDCEVYLVSATSQHKELNSSLISPQIVPQKVSDVLKLQEWFNVGQKCLPSIHSQSRDPWSALCVILSGLFFTISAKKTCSSSSGGRKLPLGHFSESCACSQFDSLLISWFEALTDFISTLNWNSF